MVGEERAPRLRWRCETSRHGAQHRGLADYEAELEQLPVDARSAPADVVPGHLPNEGANLGILARSPSSLAALPTPIQGESLAVPADHRRRLHDRQGRPPLGPHPGQHDPERAIRPVEPGTLHLVSQHGQLLSQRQVLQHQRSSRLEARPRRCQHGQQERPHGSRSLRPTRGTSRISRNTRS
jgi:hypothetical protein